MGRDGQHFARCADASGGDIFAKMKAGGGICV